MKEQSSRVSRRWLGVAVGLGISGAIANGNRVMAQAVPDQTLGSENSVITPNLVIRGLPSDRVDGGVIRGINLFHSFEQFNVGAGRGIYFTNPTGVENILSRVTGSNRSEILGRLGVLGNGNLFLLNPNGIVFGINATLDVTGSFTATTANAIQFGDRGSFSASAPNVPSALLTINPSAFLFNQINAAPIQSNSRNLYVGDGQSLVLLGGDVTLNNSFLGVATVVGGRAELGGLSAPGKVDLAVDGGIFHLTFPDNVLRADVSLRNFSRVDVTAGDGGSIGINARNLILQNSRIFAGINGGNGSDISKAGDIDVNTTSSVTLVEGSRISNSVFEDNTGNSGNISIQTRQLVVRDSKIVSAVVGSGKAGNLTIYASDFVDLNGEGQGPGGLLVQIEDMGTGQGGDLFLETRHLSISDGSKIQVASFGNGNAGNLFIRASDIDVIETSKPNVYSTSINADIALNVGSTNTPTGNGGNVTIETERLRTLGGASVSTSTDGRGNAGDLIVYASDFIELSGDRGRNGGPGGLLAQVNPGATGHGGNLTVETRRLSISDGSKIQVSTFGDGDAGTLFIKASEIDVFNTPSVSRFFSTSINADVARDSRFSGIPKGNGGDLTIETGRLSIRSGAEVTVDTSGQGNAGRLLIKATDLVEVVGRNAFLTADVNSGAVGKGGSLTIDTKRLSIRDGGQVGSSTFGIGNAGDVFVHATDIDISGVAANGNLSGLFSTSSQNARGNGGNLFVEAGNLNLNNSGRLSAQSRGTGTGGNITVNAKNIRMRSNSAILTISNSGDGGNITLNAQTIVALENSDILAFAPAGRGGNITFNTRAFLSDPLYRPSPSITDRAALFALLANDRVDVNASGTVSGTVNGVPDISFLQNSLTQLPTSLTDTTQLLANSCIVRSRKQNGRFVITGSGGLPLRPGDAPLSPFPTGEVRGVAEVRGEEKGVRGEGKQGEQGESYVIQNSTPGTQNLLDRPWKIGDPIVEPQGVYKLANGELVMSRECP